MTAVAASFWRRPGTGRRHRSTKANVPARLWIPACAGMTAVVSANAGNQKAVAQHQRECYNRALDSRLRGNDGSCFVIPAHAGIQKAPGQHNRECFSRALHYRLRGNDGGCCVVLAKAGIRKVAAQHQRECLSHAHSLRRGPPRSPLPSIALFACAFEACGFCVGDHWAVELDAVVVIERGV
jgi:hypothetical protein